MLEYSRRIVKKCSKYNMYKLICRFYNRWFGLNKASHAHKCRKYIENITFFLPTWSGFNACT